VVTTLQRGGSVGIKMESTYIPCVICKREILLRQLNLGVNTVIDVNYSILPSGEPVVGNDFFGEFLK